MEVVIGVTIRQLLLHLNCASKFEALGHASVSSGESFLAVFDNELRTRLWLVGHQVLLICQITVAVSVSVRIRVTIRQVASKYRLSSYGQSLRFSCSIVYT